MTIRRYVKPEILRREIREGGFTGTTAGQCPGYVQANLVGLPPKYAGDFLTFCEKNRAPCPLLEVTRTGMSVPEIVAKEADLLTDLPRYDIFVDGVYAETVTTIKGLDIGGMVFFLLGCSFTFERALIERGVEIKNVKEGKNVSMFRTSIQLEPSGPFSGEMVVSMRPIHYTRVIETVLVTARYPLAHGAPLHVGAPHLIGISNLESPDFGDPVSVEGDEIPLFWACGVTPRVVLENARIPLAVMHHPGHMFVTDLRDGDIQDRESLDSPTNSEL